MVATLWRTVVIPPDAPKRPMNLIELRLVCAARQEIVRRGLDLPDNILLSA
jgi:hypothetical protein